MISTMAEMELLAFTTAGRFFFNFQMSKPRDSFIGNGLDHSSIMVRRFLALNFSSFAFFTIRHSSSNLIGRIFICKELPFLFWIINVFQASSISRMASSFLGEIGDFLLAGVILYSILLFLAV